MGLDMQIPSGQVNPGMSFFQAMQGLAQRPQQPAQAAQAQAAARPVDGTGLAQKAHGDTQQANRPADSTQRAARAAESGANHRRGSFLDLKV